MLDTCIWISRSDPTRGVPKELQAIRRLFELEAERRVALAKADTVDVERTEGVEEAEATRRILDTAGTIEVFGPLVFDHSRLDHAVLGSPQDDTGITRVLALVHPGTRREETSRKARHNVRDALHIWTAIRYHYQVFVTTDRAVLASAGRFRQQSDLAIEILSPTEAVSWVERAVAKEQLREERRRKLEL
jgi:hypothetical protein